MHTDAGSAGGGGGTVHIGRHHTHWHAAAAATAVLNHGPYGNQCCNHTQPAINSHHRDVPWLQTCYAPQQQAADHFVLLFTHCTSAKFKAPPQACLLVT